MFEIRPRVALLHAAVVLSCWVTSGAARADVILPAHPKELSCSGLSVGQACDAEGRPGRCVSVPYGPYKTKLYCLSGDEEERLSNTGDWHPLSTPSADAGCARRALEVGAGAPASMVLGLVMVAMGALSLRRLRT